MRNKNVSDVVRIRRKVFVELIKLVVEDSLEEKIDALPRKIIEEETDRHRCCKYKEQAIIKERIKLSLGFVPEQYPHHPLSKLAENVHEGPEEKQPVRVLDIACDGCPIDKYTVTDACRNCVAHKCVNSCPRDAIVFIKGRAYIDQDKCVECGICKKVCPYDAIHENIRPCVRVCEVEAIKADQDRRAQIDHKNCVNCGSCITACPFGAIDNLSQIVQVMYELKGDGKTTALLAPSFLGQFGPRIKPDKINKALLEIGFNNVHEVAVGADEVIKEEAAEFMEYKKEGKECMTSSCCPSFISLIDKFYPELREHVSSTVSPMVKMARMVKNDSPNETTVFIGPCVAKKAEAFNYDAVDYVLTFEELISLLVGNGLNLEKLPGGESLNEATTLGRKFPYSGGVSKAVKTYFDKNYNMKEANYIFVQGEGLEGCKQQLEELKEGKADFDFMEGMACVEGCIDGPGNLINCKVAKKLVNQFAENAEKEIPSSRTNHARVEV